MIKTFRFCTTRRTSPVFLIPVSLIALAVSLALSGCSDFFTAQNNGGGTSTTSYIYATNLGATLAEYQFSGGVLTSLSGSPVTLPLAPTCIAIAPNNSFLYVGTASGVFLYNINSDGTVTEGNGNNVAYLNTTIAGAVIASSLAIDPSNSWLLISYRNSTNIDAVQLSTTTGLPTGNVFYATTTFATPSPQLAISAANSQVFSALGTGGVNAFGFSPTTTTSPNGPWGTRVAIPLHAANASSNAVAVDPTSTYLYIAEANSNGSGTATAGTLRLVGTSNLATDLDDQPTGIGPSAVLSDLTGAYAYVTNNTDNTISGFSLSTTTNMLTTLGAAFPTMQSPVDLVEDSSKSYILVIGNKANPNLWLYIFDASSPGVLNVKSTASTASVNPSLGNGIVATH